MESKTRINFVALVVLTVIYNIFLLIKESYYWYKVDRDLKKLVHELSLQIDNLTTK